MTHPVRRNIAHLSVADRTKYIDAVVAADQRFWSGGPVSYWDFQDLAHQTTHVHGGPKFLLWHRELCNRWEALLQQVDPDVALHYWDWTTDPRSSPDGQGGTTDLSDNNFMGTMNGNVAGKLQPLHNSGVFNGSRQQTGLPQDPPQTLLRSLPPGPGTTVTDASIVSAGNGFPQAQQWREFRQRLEQVHGAVHVRFGPGNIGDPSGHEAFQDPFVFMLHSNVDRLYAQWQTQPGQEWRLDVAQVYGTETSITGDDAITGNTLAPWDGSSGAFPFTPAGGLVNVKPYLDPSLVVPPCYDTLPLTVQQVAPLPGDPVRFVDVVEHLPTARAVRLRVRSCATVTAATTATATPPFGVLSASVTSPEPDGFGEVELLVWVLFTPGAAGTSPSGTVTVTVSPTGDVFTIPITTTVVQNPSVGTSLVLDTSGSMSLPSGLPNKDRMAVLHDSAPLFVALLDADDGVGVVRFDTNATPVTPVIDAGPTIGGAGRLAAQNAVVNTATNLAGLTAIGDGLEAAAAQLAPVAANYDSTATIVFTDGNETAEKTIAQAAGSVNSRVFAIGLGTADQLNPGALSDIANGTGGYLLLTGNPGVDDQLVLQKYFAQVLAGATNAAIVVDPTGFVPVGGKAVIPFDLTDADVRFDVLVLGETASVFLVEIIAPDGTSLTAGAGADETRGDAFRVLRAVPADVLPPPTTAAGQWQVVLSIDDGELKKWFERLRKRLSQTKEGAQIFKQAVTSVNTHGVPYTVSVQARSALRMSVTLSQASRLPGSTGHLEVTLTDSGVPLPGSAALWAEVTSPTGAIGTVTLTESAPAVYNGDINTSVSGIYRVLVRATGADLRGIRFTREELRTLAVWARGDDAPPVVTDPTSGEGPGIDICELLVCLLRDDGIRRLLERHDVDRDAVGRCVKRACR